VTKLRKLVSVLILAPLAVVFVSLAVANRQLVAISLDPFDAAHPALTVSVPLFALILALVIGGVILGGCAAWLRQSKWRRAARMAEAQARELQAEVDELRAQSIISIADDSLHSYSPRLTIPPPAA
jgi:uncharacterized integral membrane protein